MCDPVTITLAAGTAVAAAGQVSSGIYASRVASYRAQVAQQNKQLSHEAGADAIIRGQEDQRRLGRDVAQRVGSQEARMAANNTDITFGSAARMIADTKLIGAEDQATLAENIRRQVRGQQIDAYNFESERRAARAEHNSAMVATAFGVGSTVLGGATQYAKFKTARLSIEGNRAR